MIERISSRGCSQIDKLMHHPLLHDQIVLVTSPIILMDYQITEHMSNHCMCPMTLLQRVM